MLPIDASSVVANVVHLVTRWDGVGAMLGEIREAVRSNMVATWTGAGTQLKVALLASGVAYDFDARLRHERMRYAHEA